MRLYLLRHGRSPSVLEARVAKDSERPLSDAGRADVGRTARFLAEKGGRPALILHSPLVRAAQTAAEAAKALKPASGVEPFEPLANAIPADALLSEVSRRAEDCPEVLLVGHQPQLGELAALLTGQIFELKPGGLIALELAEGRKAAVLWNVNPDGVPAR